MHDISNDILKKLRKLIEHEKSARAIGSLHEADAFAQKISELCDRYRIAVADVPEAERPDDIQVAKWDPAMAEMRELRRQSNWQRKMACGVAYGHFCELLVYPGSNAVSFVGTVADVEIACAMLTILCRAAVASCDTARRRHQNFQPNQYLFGFALAIAIRYREQREKQESQHSDAVQALVRQTNEKIRQKFSNIPISKRPKEPRYNESMQAGYDAGLQQNLDTRLIKGEPSPKLIKEA